VKYYTICPYDRVQLGNEARTTILKTLRGVRNVVTYLNIYRVSHDLWALLQKVIS